MTHPSHISGFTLWEMDMDLDKETPLDLALDGLEWIRDARA
jgi:hypothetical protein